MERTKRKYFYEVVTESQKSEFIDGEIVVHSPVKLIHNLVSNNLFILLKSFVKKNNLGFVGFKKILVNLSRNDYEPDLCFFHKEKSSLFKPKQMFFPAPDLIVEVISESTEKIDRGIKFEDYEFHKVSEYWIINPEDKFVEQYVNIDDKYPGLDKPVESKS